MITVVSMYAHTNDTIAVATLNLEDGATASGTALDAGTEENVDGQDDSRPRARRVQMRATTPIHKPR